ncbi:right-handed parallel beta-helix repeat-containing protein [Zavarzinella formosa]|uniref:right-handed parallel beta-helix repeat-containing protein n=1 Tax=Zavarzinella formosa TaxID=360055 RepID=UPI0002F89EC0|nr:right-handed parallel beta-helix repeat-containing protein [Zavarzinella formosa]
MLCPVCLTPVPRFVEAEDPTGANILRCPNPGCEDSNIPLLYAEEYASHPAIACSMIGLPGHGKTRYIDGLLQGIYTAGRHWPDFAYQWLDERTAMTVRQRRQDYEAGIPPLATAVTFPEPVICRLSDVPRVGGCQLLFFDVSGEVFLNSVVLRDAGRFVRNSPAVIWLNSLVQPTDDGEGLIPVDPASLSDMLTVYRQGMATMGGDTKNQRVIFTVTKADLYLKDADFPESARHILEKDIFAAGTSVWEIITSLSADLEQWLRGRGYHNVINLLRRQFKEVFFTVVSAQGSDTLLQPGVRMEPRAVLLPLFWLWRTQRPAVWIEHDGRREYASSLPLAIESAPPGATIVLDPGIHFIPKPLTFRQSVILRGTDAETTIIEGARGPFLAGVNLAEGVFSAQSVTFRHQGTRPSDLIRVLAGRVEFHDCIFRGARASEDRRVAGNALVLDQAGVGAAVECRFQQNKGSGLVVSCTRPFLVSECQFQLNAVSGISVVAGTVNVSKSNFRTNAYGVRVSRQATGDVSRCEFHDCVHGVSVSDSATVRVREESLFQGNRKCGVRLEKSATAVCENSRFIGNKEIGISVAEHATLTAEGNQLTRNKVGVRTEGNTQTELRENKFESQTNDGAVFADESRVDCTDNDFYHSSGHGIRVEGSSRPVMDGNRYGSNTGGDVFIGATVHRSVVPDKPPKGQPPYRITDKRK